MTDANHKQSSPVVAFVRKNAVVVGVSAALLIGVGTFAANALQPERTAAPAAGPTVNSTAILDGGAVATPTASPGSTTGATTVAPSAAPGDAVGGQPGSGASGGSAGQPGGESRASHPSAQPTTTVTLGTANQAPTLQDWKPTAEKFSAAWANPSAGKEAWLEAMKPYVTEELLAKFSKTDIRNVPQDTLYNIRSIKHDERHWVFSPAFDSGKDRFTGQVTVQTDGSWLVDYVGAPE